MHNAAKKWTISETDLSRVAKTAPAGNDLEPEYVDINEENDPVVSFQENNFLAVVDIVTGSTIETFDALSVEL